MLGGNEAVAGCVGRLALPGDDVVVVLAVEGGAALKETIMPGAIFWLARVPEARELQKSPEG